MAFQYTADFSLRRGNLVIIRIWTFMAWKLHCNVHTYVYSAKIADSYTHILTFPSYNKQDATFLDLFISTNALHVPGGSYPHHQEHKTEHTASGYCQPILLLAASVDEMLVVTFKYIRQARTYECQTHMLIS